jgi:hypothetical protein
VEAVAAMLAVAVVVPVVLEHKARAAVAQDLEITAVIRQHLLMTEVAEVALEQSGKIRLQTGKLVTEEQVKRTP